jgi:hypothetical protein
MQGITRVTRLRVSHVSTRIHDRLQVIGQPVAFAQRLSSLAPVHGLDVALPFGDGLPVDTDFWSRIAERRLTVPVPESIAPKLRTAGIPLRYRGTLETAADVPRLEAHLHPFGVVAMTTVDLRWSEPMPLGDVWRAVDRLDGESATIVLSDARRATTLGQAAADAATGLVGLLTLAGIGEALDLPPHRLVTVISGVGDVPPVAMPTANSPVHLALHHLSAGDRVIAEPATAFVAQWTGAGYSWPATNLLYMLDRGTSLLPEDVAAAAPAEPGQRTADQHRHLLLLLAYLNVTTGLVRAARTKQPGLLQAWADTAAKRLGRLFGPGREYLDWGLAPRALLMRTGASEDVAGTLGVALMPNPNYPVPDYA